MADWIAFWVIAPISVLSAAAMVLARNAVHAALFLIVNFFTLAVFFLILGSPFLFVVQIIVYAGAIMVLFLFVIMLLGVDRAESLTEPRRLQRTQGVLAVIVGIPLVAGLAATLVLPALTAEVPELSQPDAYGSAEAVGQVLFRQYLLPFEVTALVLLVAALAILLLARRRSTE